MSPKRWDSQENVPWNPPSHRAGKLAVAAALTGGAGYAAMNYRFSSGTAMDYAHAVIRHTGNVSPYSILNTFRGAQWLSPWLSTEAQGLSSAKDLKLSGSLPGAPGARYHHWAEEMIGDDASKEWIRKVAGSKRFQQAGLDVQPFEMLYSRGGKDTTGAGSLWARVRGGDAWQKLSGSVSLFEATPVDPKIAATRGIQQEAMNPALTGIWDAMGMSEIWGKKSYGKFSRAFRTVTEEGKPGGMSKYVPIPALLGKDIDGWQGVHRRFSTYVGGPLAQGMGRMNRLLEQTMDQLPILRNVNYAFEQQFKTGMGVQPGPASKMFARFGTRAAAVGAIGVGVAQSDWIRRHYGVGGHLAATGLTTTAITYAAHKMFNRTPLTFGVAAASAVGQLILPGFREGLVPGAITTASNLSIGKSMVGSLTFMNTYRRTLEGFLPGASDWKTSVLAGLGVAGFSYMGGSAALIKKHGYRGILPASLEKFIGVEGADFGLHADPPPTIRSLYRDEVHSIAQKRLGTEYGSIMSERGWVSFKNRKIDLALQRQGQSSGTWRGLMDELDLAWETASTKYGQFLSGELEGYPNLNNSLRSRIAKINGEFQGRTASATSKRFLAKSGTKIWHSFLGMNPAVASLREDLGVLGAKSHLGRLGLLFGAGALGWSMVTGGLLGSMEDPSELADIYSGRQHVTVKEGRAWEAGGAPFEGKKPLYSRPHNFALLMSRARQKAVWGDDEDEISPVKKFLLKNFSYELEKRTYWDRPHVVSSAAFEGIPVIGGLLASTIGQIVKPPKLMHISEWARQGPNGEIEFAHKPEYGNISYEMGGLTPGAPHSPYSSPFQAGYAAYQYNELAGLFGWALNTATKAVTGSDMFATQRPVLASAGAISSAQKAFWDLELAGALGLSEGIRRFLPRDRSEVEEYNPLINNTPSWLPDRFAYGDPYRSVDRGHVRLPGPGYSALHPELKGMDPENYPRIYRYMILADVANQSREFKQTRQSMYQKRASGQTTDSENRMMDLVDSRLEKIQAYDTFQSVHDNAIQVPGLSRVSQGMWATAQRAFRKTVAPVEYLTPFRPVQKLLYDRDKMEAYEWERLYGGPNAFWDAPQRDFLRPAMYSALHNLGWDGKPLWRQEVDRDKEYFDKLEFVKWMRAAESAPTGQERRRALLNAQKTKHGVNPQGSPLSIYASLPESEKRFFDAFTFAPEKDRERIKEMVPADQVHLYEAIWNRVDSGDRSLHPASPTSIDEAYLNARFHDLQGYFQQNPLPPEDWSGWKSNVELDDIQLRYVERIGRDIHDYEMWDRQSRQLTRKPYLEGSEDFLFEGHPLTRDSIASQIHDMGRRQSGPAPQLSVHSVPGSLFDTQARFYHDDNREDVIGRLLNALE
jgi:hypothetical protein